MVFFPKHSPNNLGSHWRSPWVKTPNSWRVWHFFAPSGCPPSLQWWHPWPYSHGQTGGHRRNLKAVDAVWVTVQRAQRNVPKDPNMSQTTLKKTYLFTFSKNWICFLRGLHLSIPVPLVRLRNSKLPAPFCAHCRFHATNFAPERLGITPEIVGSIDDHCWNVLMYPYKKYGQICLRIQGLLFSASLRAEIWSTTVRKRKFDPYGLAILWRSLRLGSRWIGNSNFGLPHLNSCWGQILTGKTGNINHSVLCSVLPKMPPSFKLVAETSVSCFCPLIFVGQNHQRSTAPLASAPAGHSPPASRARHRWHLQVPWKPVLLDDWILGPSGGFFRELFLGDLVGLVE